VSCEHGNARPRRTIQLMTQDSQLKTDRDLAS
jgi:hypothetical protein